MRPNSSILASCPLRPARDCGRPAQGPPMHISRPSTIHKKLQSPQSHISQAIHCSPCLADPHAPRILIRAISPYGSRGSSMPHTSSKNPIPIPPRPAFRSPHIPNQNPQIHVRTCTAMARAIPPRPATGLRKCASDRFTQIHCAGEGGMGMASLGDASTPTTVGPAPACVIGPEGPITVKPKGLTGLKARRWACMARLGRAGASRRRPAAATPTQGGLPGVTSPPGGGLCVSATCSLTLLFTTATSDVCLSLIR